MSQAVASSAPVRISRSSPGEPWEELRVLHNAPAVATGSDRRLGHPFNSHDASEAGPAARLSFRLVNAVHGRSDGIEGGSQLHGRPPTNAGERPRPMPLGPPTQLESVRPRATFLARRAPLRGAVRLHRGHVPGNPALVRTTVETGGGRRGSYAVQVWSAHREGHSVPAAGDGRCVAMQSAPWRVVVVHHREAQGSRTQGEGTQAS